MTLQEAITLNLVGIFLAAALAGFFWTAGERSFGFWWTGWVGFCLSIVGWSIFVAAHFILKYW